MENMHSLKKNKTALILTLALLLTLPFFPFYLDTVVILFVKHFRQTNPFDNIIRHIDSVIGLVSNGATLLAIAILLYLLGRPAREKLYDAGKSLTIGLIVISVLVQALKHLIGRARPGITDSLVVIGPTLKVGYDSFPSGHTISAFAFAYILSQYYPRYKILLFTFAVIAALDRINVLFHFPSDVITGAIIGIFVSQAVLARIKAKQGQTF